MDRRGFLKTAGAAATAGLASQLTVAAETEDKEMENRDLRAAPCGLYCGVCPDYLADVCHGCRCKCGKCIGQGHFDICEIAQCASKRKLSGCSDCKELPCSMLIQFTFDPVWRTHNQCIENLRRQKKIGVASWLAEQELYWKDERKRKAWFQLGKECEARLDDLDRANEKKN